MSDYKLVVSFPDQSESFVLGFEAGELWSEMKRNVELIEKTVHRKNLEVFYRISEARFYEMSVKNTDIDEWIDITFTKKKADLKLVP